MARIKVVERVSDNKVQFNNLKKKLGAKLETKKSVKEKKTKIKNPEEEIKVEKPIEENVKDKKSVKETKPKIQKQKEDKLRNMKKKAKVVIGPRLQLEPRLTPKKCPVDLNKSKEHLTSVGKDDIQPNGSVEQVIPERTELLGINNIEGQMNESVTAENCSYNEDFIEHERVKNESRQVIHSARRYKISRSQRETLRLKWWSSRELQNLAIGLQRYGFRETKKIAELVKTRSETEVREFIKYRSSEARMAASAIKRGRKGRPKNAWTGVHPVHLQSWPNVRKWRRVAFDQMLNLSRMKDYSKPVLISMLTHFYEEEQEPSDPQVINVKSIYKYLLDCIAGELPAQLPCKESAFMLDMLKDLKLFNYAYDTTEEEAFLKKYTEATRYRPFQVKDEFKKRFGKTNTDALFKKNSVAVPEEIFANLSMHKRLVQSFNPLTIPLWMTQRQQKNAATLI